MLFRSGNSLVPTITACSPASLSKVAILANLGASIQVSGTNFLPNSTWDLMTSANPPVLVSALAIAKDVDSTRVQLTVPEAVGNVGNPAAGDYAIRITNPLGAVVISGPILKLTA